jgi:hypothetical protein
MKYWKVIFFCTGLVWAGCQSQPEGEIPTPATPTDEPAAQIPMDIPWTDTFYVPVYSDIYSGDEDRRFQLTITLSIRNTSLSDTLFVTQVDYYNTKGALVRSYLEKPTLLQPLETKEFLVKKSDTSGGSGANFIVACGGNHAQLDPLVQAVMISTTSRQGLSFTTEGISIAQKGN